MCPGWSGCTREGSAPACDVQEHSCSFPFTDTQGPLRTPCRAYSRVSRVPVQAPRAEARGHGPAAHPAPLEHLARCLLQPRHRHVLDPDLAARRPQALRHRQRAGPHARLDRRRVHLLRPLRKNRRMKDSGRTGKNRRLGTHLFRHGAEDALLQLRRKPRVGEGLGIVQSCNSETFSVSETGTATNQEASLLYKSMCPSSRSDGLRAPQATACQGNLRAAAFRLRRLLW